MWLLRILNCLQENFAFGLMGLLVAEGIFGLVMMFVFPPASLAMVFLGLVTLALSVIVKVPLNWSVAILSRMLGVDPPSAVADTPPA